MDIRVELEEDPGIRFTGTAGSCEYDGREYRLMSDFGCGVYIKAGDKRFRLSPEALIHGVHRALKKAEADA